MTSIDADHSNAPVIVTVRLDHDEPLQVASLGQLLESIAVTHHFATGDGDSSLYFDEIAQRWRVLPGEDDADDLSPDVVAMSENFVIEFATVVLVAKFLGEVAGVVGALIATVDFIDRKRQARRKANDAFEGQGEGERGTQIAQQVAGDLVVNGNVFNITVTVESP